MFVLVRKLVMSLDSHTEIQLFCSCMSIHFFQSLIYSYRDITLSNQRANILRFRYHSWSNGNDHRISTIGAAHDIGVSSLDMSRGYK